VRRKLVAIGIAFAVLTIANLIIYLGDLWDLRVAEAALTGPPSDRGSDALERVVGKYGDFPDAAIGFVVESIWREATLVAVCGIGYLLVTRSKVPKP
jgi:hypothetical protein